MRRLLFEGKKRSREIWIPAEKQFMIQMICLQGHESMTTNERRGEGSGRSVIKNLMSRLNSAQTCRRCGHVTAQHECF